MNQSIPEVEKARMDILTKKVNEWLRVEGDTTIFDTLACANYFREVGTALYEAGRRVGEERLTQKLKGRTDLGYEYLNGLEEALNTPTL